jgi:ribosome maturation protein Sdo1
MLDQSKFFKCILSKGTIQISARARLELRERVEDEKKSVDK